MTQPTQPLNEQPSALADELERLAEKATPGPWARVCLAHVVTRIDGNHSYTTYRPDDDDLLLALRNNLPALLTALKTTDPQVAVLREALERIRRTPSSGKYSGDEMVKIADTALNETRHD